MTTTMGSKMKQMLAQNFYNAIGPKTCSIEQIIGRFNVGLHKKKGVPVWVMNLDPKHFEAEAEMFKSCQKELVENNMIRQINLGDNTVEVEVPVHNFIKDTLDSNPLCLNFEPISKKIIVEYSSPNIAKPFHVGHLRSTMIGNYVANLKQKLGKKVHKINYLGDWGTQLGILQLGVEEEKLTLEELDKDPITLLYKAYVKGNKLTFNNDEAYKKAMKIFGDLEGGDTRIQELWCKYRDWTVKELQTIYGRLGVVFDEYSWESDYNRSKANSVLKLLELKGLLSDDEKGRKVATIAGEIIPLIKSDNSTLYLTRDLMAVIDRKEKHKFDEMYYVVENGQSHHFDCLFKLCNELGINQDVNIEHVKFGRIHGMSTRKGKLVFLKDVLDEAKERAYERQVKSKTTKISLENKDVADIIGVSAVIVNDLKHQRKHDYEMHWESILQLTGSTGSFLQYTHCRLWNLMRQCTIASECDPEAFQEPEAINLIIEISKYESILLRSNRKIEPSILIRYMFDLAKAVNKALLTLNVKNSDEHLGGQRLLLFEKSRLILEDSLKLLGLVPLQQM